MKKIISILLFLSPFLAFSQSILLAPKQEYKNETSDTMVVTTVEKIRKAVIAGKELKIALQEIDKSNELIENLQKQNTAFEEKSNAQNEIIESYKKQIEGSETHASNLKKEVKRQKRQKIMIMGGSALLIVLSLVLF
jgi:predicted RNase H-like nuclease (RuvC/YqgF family)